MTCVAAFTSLAFPAPSVIVSLRWMYWANGSWSQATALEHAQTPANVTTAMIWLIFMMSTSPLACGWIRTDQVSVRPLDAPSARYIVIILLSQFHIPEQEEIDIIGRQMSVQWSGETLTRNGRRDEVRGYNHDQIALILLK